MTVPFWTFTLQRPLISMILLTLNEGYDRKSIDILLVLAEMPSIQHISGDGIATYAALAASRLLAISERRDPGQYTPGKIFYQVKLTERGHKFVEAWKNGDQAAAIGLGGPANN